MNIIIPGRQNALKDEIIYVMLDGVKIGLPCETEETSTASYDTVFNSDDFEPNYHGFVGIMNGLKKLCNYVEEVVNIETVSQFQHKLLIDAGMPFTAEPFASDGIKVTFSVTSEVAEKYNSLLEYDISEWKLIIAQSE